MPFFYVATRWGETSLVQILKRFHDSLDECEVVTWILGFPERTMWYPG